jgi:hypothetical protein
MSMRCPCCESPIVHRSKRRGLERVLSLLDVYPFRCAECHRRFFSVQRVTRETVRAQPSKGDGAAT